MESDSQIPKLLRLSEDGNTKTNSEENNRSCNGPNNHVDKILSIMSQELTNKNLPTTPLAYLAATCSSLHRILSVAESDDIHLIEPLLTVLSLLIPKINKAALPGKKKNVSEILVAVLRLSHVVSVKALVAAFNCLKSLLVLSDGDASWSLYQVLLEFLTHSDDKVREQATACLLDIFQEPASEGISNIFEKSLLLAGRASGSSSDGSKGAQDVLFLLDALKVCLPLMSVKYNTNVLNHFKTLLDLRQPVVTTRIIICLNFLCQHSTTEVSPEALVDLLSSLALSISTNETSVDILTSTARLLVVGMKKVYALRRDLCVLILPVVFNALKDILESQNRKTLYSAMDAMKELITDCIDESLIKQGVKQILTSSSMDLRPGPTIIAKVCATTESLLDYRYSAVWDVTFQVLETLFDKLGNYSRYFLSTAIKSLADLQKLVDEKCPYRKQLYKCIGSAVGAIGLEAFLQVLPLKLDGEDISQDNDWLFRILQKYTVGARLCFFKESILPMIGPTKQKSKELELEGRMVLSRRTHELVESLWSLLPSICNYPIDTADSFRQLETHISKALREEPPRIRQIVCNSLQTLVSQNKDVLSKKDLFGTEMSMSQQQAINHYTTQVASENLVVLRASACDLLNTLCSVFLKSTEDDAGHLQVTIGEIASITDKKVVTKFFGSTMQKILKVTEEACEEGNDEAANSMQIDNSSCEIGSTCMRARLLELAVSFLPGLNDKEIDLLFVVIRPALQDVEGLIQREAYNVLARILDYMIIKATEKCEGYNPSKVMELLKLMAEVPSCHFSAKRYRADCLYYLIVLISKENSGQRWDDILCSFLPEIILSLKEANKMTRRRAYDMLVEIGRLCGNQFFCMVAGGLAGETPHMVSAAIKGLAHLTYVFSDLLAAAYNVLPSIYVLLQHKNKEIIKASLAFLKVLVAKSQAEWLKVHLRGMVEGLLKCQDDTRNHFKAKVRLLLELLIRKCDLDTVKAVMPVEHMKLLLYIRKSIEKKVKKHSTNSEESKSQISRATISRSKRMQTGRILSEDVVDDLENEPLDLLDQVRTRSALGSSEFINFADSDDEPELDSEGRLIVCEGAKPKKRSSHDADLDSNREADNCMSVKAMNKYAKRRKTSESGWWSYAGAEYASKKAAGDVQKKGKFEPYAYWPLDRKMMSRRQDHRAAARKGMASVAKLTKRLEGMSTTAFLTTRACTKMVQKKKGCKKKNWAKFSIR